MSTAHDPAPSAELLAGTTLDFVKAFDAWLRRASMANAGESMPRLRLLYELHCNGPRKMADLADSLAVTPRNVTALVDALEAEALVRRSPHATDRRVTMIELTGGATKVAQQFAAFQGAIESLFEDLSEQDRGALVRVLSSLQARIEAAEFGTPVADAERY
jgi:DNA-binding MarR family transcriptional regulator